MRAVKWKELVEVCKGVQYRRGQSRTASRNGFFVKPRSIEEWIREI